jgi:hypothetical protein
MEASITRASEAAETTADTATTTTDRVREDLEVTERWVRDVVRGHPITCFLAAVTSGYLIGRIARRI